MKALLLTFILVGTMSGNSSFFLYVLLHIPLTCSNVSQNTVLLNANVAFLAIQSIDNFSGHPGRSPAQIASFLSIVASFGSIILGLVLARKHRAKARDTAADAVCDIFDLGRPLYDTN